MEDANLYLVTLVARRLRQRHSLQAYAESAWYADATIAVVRIPLGDGALGDGSWFWTPQADGLWHGSLVLDGRETLALEITETDPARVPAAIVTALAKAADTLEARHGQ